MKKLNPHWILGTLLCLLCTQSLARPERTMSLDLAFGIPQVAWANGSVLVWKNVQVGFGYTYVPTSSVFGASFELDPIELELADGNTYETTPSVTPGAGILSPFIRFFPTDSNFYISFQYTYIQLTAQLEGSFRNTNLPIPISLGGALLTGNIKVKQFLPTFGVGYLAIGRRVFFNLFIGGTVFGNISTSSNVEIYLPEEVGGLIGNAAVVEELNQNLNTELRDFTNEAIQDIKGTYPFLPAIQLAFGFFI